MLARRLLSVAPVLLTCIPCALGQLPKKLEKCLPYPTLAQEIRERQPEPEPARVRVHVIRVVFDSNDGIPADAQQEISEELRSHVFEPEADNCAYQKLRLIFQACFSASVTMIQGFSSRLPEHRRSTAMLLILQRLERDDIFGGHTGMAIRALALQDLRIKVALLRIFQNALVHCVQRIARFEHGFMSHGVFFFGKVAWPIQMPLAMRCFQKLAGAPSGQDADL